MGLDDKIAPAFQHEIALSLFPLESRFYGAHLSVQMVPQQDWPAPLRGLHLSCVERLLQGTCGVAKSGFLILDRRHLLGNI